MPEDTEYAPLIQRILTKTREGHIDWQAGEDKETFFCKVDKYLFLSQKSTLASTVTYYLRMYEGSNEVLSIVARKHAAGRIDAHFPTLEEIYELARQHALKINVKVNEALSLLDKLK